MLLKNVNKLNFIMTNFKTKIYNSYSTTTNVGIIGVPFCKGQRKAGVDTAPTILRNNGLLDELRNIGNLKINDYGDITYELDDNIKPLENALNYADFYAVNKALSLKIPEILKENDKYLVLGGDHSIGFGSIAGHLAYDPNISVIWIDAHADLNTNLSSDSGNIHGMPLSMIIEELKEHYIKTDIRKIVKNYLSVKNLYYIGLRDVDTFENSFIKENAIVAFGMMDIEKFGISKIIETILNSIKENSKIHISFDVDALDPSIAPSTGTRVSGGLTLREIFYIFEKLHDTGKITGVDIVEINPLIGDDSDVKLTTKMAIETIKMILGYKGFKK